MRKNGYGFPTTASTPHCTDITRDALAIQDRPILSAGYRPLETWVMMNKDLQLVDEILDSFKEVIAADYDGYRNHVCRVVSLCYSASEFADVDREKIQIAGSFHDIGIWTAGTLDYLPPSEEAARAYLKATGREDWIPEIAEMIELHHRIHSCVDSKYSLVEPFRRADTADFSLGMVRMGMSRDLIRNLKSEFQNRGFHKRLVTLGCQWCLRHPFNPLPMFRR